MVEKWNDPGLEDLVREELVADWKAHGAELLARLRIMRPAEYVRLLLALMPQAPGEAAPELDQLSGDELRERLEEEFVRLGRAGIAFGKTPN